MMTNSTSWTAVCSADDLVANSGVCALIEDQQIALFKVSLNGVEQLFAISNWDPIGLANVLYRGILCSVADKTVVASPLYKQRFCLLSGQCIDDASQKVQVYPVRLEGQNVFIQLPCGQ
ncbi:MAG: nitrite reductase (NADH) small subunit [Paraglaciecola sp.]|jgi:nitrite reductase (NADH) small subunit